jgi:hypothetical protein
MKYQSKPTSVWAIQWDGTLETLELMDKSLMPISHCYEMAPKPHWELQLLAGVDGAQGWVPVPVGHWVVRSANVMNDHWPVEDIYFRDKYEKVTP